MVKVCDRALFLKGGRIVYQWTPESSETVCWQLAFAPPLPEAALSVLSAHPGVASVQRQDARLFVSSRRGHEPGQLVALLLQQGVNVRGLWPEERSLESLFLEVVGA